MFSETRDQPHNNVRIISNSKEENDSENREVFVIGVAGGTASGKTTVCAQIISELRDHRVRIITQDSFYKALTPEQMKLAEESQYDFDHPDAFDHELLHSVLAKLKRGERVDVPIYDFSTHSRKEETIAVDPPDVLIIEGILVFYDEYVRNLMNLKVYIDTDADTRLSRRLMRDTRERGRTVASILEQYTKFVKPSFEKFVDPCKRHANLIVPWNNGNPQAVNIIVEHVRTKLRSHDLIAVYPKLDTFSSSHFQIRALHTYIRDSKTSRQDFVFYCDRLIRLVIEESLGHLPFSQSMVYTPSNFEYVGTHFTSRICGVSVIRSGEAMENGLRTVCQHARIGKILVDKVNENGEVTRNIPYVKLPTDIAQRHVILMDPISVTGRTIECCVQHLLHKADVPEENIIVVNLITSRHAVQRICTAFPKLQLITTAIDEIIDGKMVPGCPVNFGDRYFGTE